MSVTRVRGLREKGKWLADRKKPGDRAQPPLDAIIGPLLLGTRPPTEGYRRRPLHEKGSRTVVVRVHPCMLTAH